MGKPYTPRPKLTREEHRERDRRSGFTKVRIYDTKRVRQELGSGNKFSTPSHPKRAMVIDPDTGAWMRADKYAAKVAKPQKIKIDV